MADQKNEMNVDIRYLHVYLLAWYTCIMDLYDKLQKNVVIKYAK